MKNRDKLRENRARPHDATRGAPREGAALLGGLVLCGRCGRRMSPCYASRSASWSYTCWGESDQCDVTCWSVAGAAIDRAVERLFLDAMVPSEIDLSLAVEREVQQQTDSLDRAWRARIEQARYEARRAERRYKAVDPDNRVVARTLESDWEGRLRDLESVEHQYAEARRAAHIELTARDRERIHGLARDLPAVWAAPTTLAAERKAMLRLVIEAVAINPVDIPRRSTRIVVQWTSGAVDEQTIPRLHKGEYRANAPEAIERIRELAAAGLRDDEIAGQLVSDGLRTGAGLGWNQDHVRQARRAHDIERVAPDRPRTLPLPHQHPEHGWLSISGAMARFGVGESTVRRWIADGTVRTTRGDCATHRNVYWLHIDDATAAKLALIAGRRTRA
jgi:Recombinase zinc beta ribbon domain